MARFSSNARVLQKIDGSLGVVLCFCLTLLRRCTEIWSKKEIVQPESILFLKLAEQGSTVLAHEAIRLATETVGRNNVYFMVFEENRFILDLLGLIPPENVLTIKTRSALVTVLSGFERLWQIRRLRAVACIDMEFFARFTAALSWLTGARVRVGFHSYFGEGPYRGDLLTHRILYNPHIHTSSAFTSLVMALKVESDQLPTFGVTPPASVAPPMFAPDQKEALVVEQLLQSLLPAGARHLILLNANASDLLPFRKWNESNYVELARRLIAEFGEVAIGFTGAPDEAEKIGELVQKVGSQRCFCLAGKTTLRQLLVVYGFAEVLVTNDSGPAHFAALTSIDVITLFGPETPMLFGAPSPRNHIIWAGIACSPCVNALNNRQSACTNNLCMKMIDVEQVFQTVCKVYRQKSLSQTKSRLHPRGESLMSYSY